MRHEPQPRLKKTSQLDQQYFAVLHPKDQKMCPIPDELFQQMAPLAQTLHRLDEAHRRFRSYVARSLALSATEVAALLIIADTPGISPGTLADDLGITSGAVTALVDRLEDSGHARRAPYQDDRRRLEVQLTSAGQETLGKMQTAYRTVLSEADTDGTLTAILPQLGNITDTLNTAAKRKHPTID